MPPHPNPTPKTPSPLTHHPAAMVDPKNPQKGGQATSHNGPDTEDGNHEKGKMRDKYRTTIPKQANQLTPKTQMADSQKSCHGGNQNNLGKTLTDTQHVEPRRKMDEKGNDEALPDLGGNPATQHTEPSLQCCFSLEEEEELRELKMQTQDIEADYDSDPYIEHMKDDQIK